MVRAPNRTACVLLFRRRRRLSEISRRPDALSTHTHGRRAATATKVYSEFGRVAVTRD